MFPYIIAVIVAATILGYALEALSAVGDFSDPHDWTVDDDEEE